MGEIKRREGYIRRRNSGGSVSLLASVSKRERGISCIRVFVGPRIVHVLARILGVICAAILYIDLFETSIRQEHIDRNCFSFDTIFVCRKRVSCATKCREY